MHNNFLEFSYHSSQCLFSVPVHAGVTNHDQTQQHDTDGVDSVSTVTGKDDLKE